MTTPAMTGKDRAMHTPGPWSLDDLRREGMGIWISTMHPEWGSLSLAEVRPGCTEAEEQGDTFANARLIAAAPELLEALAELLRVDDEWHGSVNSEMAGARNAARAAIAKATGATP